MEKDKKHYIELIQEIKKKRGGNIYQFHLDENSLSMDFGKLEEVMKEYDYDLKTEDEKDAFRDGWFSAIFSISLSFKRE